jgi:hypothetical protein
MEMVTKKIDDAIKFMDGVKADRAAKQLYEDPAYNCDLIKGTINGLKKATEGMETVTLEQVRLNLKENPEMWDILKRKFLIKKEKQI